MEILPPPPIPTTEELERIVKQSKIRSKEKSQLFTRKGKASHSSYRGRCLFCGCNEYESEKAFGGGKCKGWSVTKGTRCGHYPGDHAFLGTTNTKCSECVCSYFIGDPILECLLCGHAFEKHNSPTTSWQIDYNKIKFSINSKPIAKGTMGEIWLGELWGQTFAVKKILAKHLSDLDLETFHKEVQLMSEFRHPNVLSLVGACLDPPNLCIVTEYATKGSLYHQLHSLHVSNPIPLSICLNIANQIAKGLCYLHHQMQVVHRDLKSQNCLLFDDWSVKINDFGLSQKISQLPILESKMVGKSKQYGTPLWMAPEIIRKEIYTTHSDIYSFSMILYELVTGCLPFEEDKMDGDDVMKSVVEGKRPSIPRWCPNNIRIIMENSWNQDPSSRPDISSLLPQLQQIRVDDNDKINKDREILILKHKQNEKNIIEEEINIEKQLSSFTVPKQFWMSKVTPIMRLQLPDGSFQLDELFCSILDIDLSRHEVIASNTYHHTNKQLCNNLWATTLAIALMRITYNYGLKECKPTDNFNSIWETVIKSMGKKKWEVQAIGFLKMHGIIDDEKNKLIDKAISTIKCFIGYPS